MRMQQAFERGFETLRHRYHGLLEQFIAHRKLFVTCFLAACVLSFALLPFIGEDFFPGVDSGEFKIHLRAPTGTRIEETAALCDRVENEIRREIPPSELETIIDNIGMPYSGDQSFLQHLRADRSGRRGHPSGTGRKTPAQQGIHSHAASAAAA